MIVALPVTALAIAALAGARLGWLRRWPALGMALGACLVLFLAMMFWPKSGEGFEDIGFAIVGFLIALPAAAGVLGGGLIGWLLQRHRAVA
ncbi:MAG: hypothetical protein AAFQ19_07020 [Pseudomonadota bacterium]